MVKFTVFKRLWSLISVVVTLFVVTFSMFAYLAMVSDAVAQQNEDKSSVFGVVRFPNKNPAADVWVEIRTNPNSAAGISFEKSLLTNLNGEFKFSDLPQTSGIEYEINFRLPRNLFGFLSPEPVVFTEAVRGDLGSFFLRKAVNNTDLVKRINGEIIPKSNPNNASLGGIDMYAIQTDSGRKRHTTTNNDGKFEFFVVGGEWKVSGESNNVWFFDDDEEKFIEFPKTNEKEEKKLILQIEPVVGDGFFKVFGRIVTQDGQKLPAGSVKIKLCNEEGKCFEGLIKAGGRFEIRVKPGSYETEIKIESSDLPYLAPDLQDRINVRDRDKDVGEFRLRPRAARTAQLTGQVLMTPTGRGVASVTVEVTTFDNGSGDRSITTTDDNGDFGLNFLPGEWSASLDLTPEQKERYIVAPPYYQYGETNKDEKEIVIFYLQAVDATINGTTVDAAGAVLTDTEGFVVAELCSKTADSSDETESDCQFVNRSGIFDGKFQLRVASGYTYRLRSSVDKDAHQAIGAVEVSLPTGTVTATTALTLRPTNRKIFGSLFNVDTDEIVSTEAVVAAYGKDGAYVEKRVNEDNGSYALPVPANTTWTVSYNVEPRSGYVAATDAFSAVVTVGSEDVRLNLPVQALSQANAINGRVVDESGAGIVDATVFAKGLKERKASDNSARQDGDGDDPANAQFDLKRVFETKTDDTGAFTLTVVSGTYQVGAYAPADLREQGYSGPKPIRWSNPSDNPVTLALRKRDTTTDGLTISGSFSAEGVANDAKIDLYAVSKNGDRGFIQGTVGDGYTLPVLSDTTWFLWAVYEDRTNKIFFRSEQISATVESESLTGVDITLTKSKFKLPDIKCLDFDAANATRFELPGRSDLLPPLLEIQANTIPADGTVTLCAKPLASVQDGQDALGFAYDLSVRDSKGNLISQNFNQNMRVIVYFTAQALAELPDGADADSLEIAIYDEDRDDWVALTDLFVDEDDGFVTGKISHFSQFGSRSVINKSGTSATQPASVYLPIVVK